MYAIYDLTSGEIQSFKSRDDAPEGYGAVASEFVNVATHHVVNGAVVERLAVIPPVDPVFLCSLIKDECKRRIYAVASAETQRNVSDSYVMQSLLSGELLAFQAWITWRDTMRAVSKQLQDNLDEAYADDSHWPAVPQAITDLMANY